MLDTARLDADKTIYVVALGPKTIVLGASSTQLRLICELNSMEAATFRERDEQSVRSPGAEGQ